MGLLQFPRSAHSDCGRWVGPLKEESRGNDRRNLRTEWSNVFSFFHFCLLDGVPTPMEATSSSPAPTRSRGGQRDSGSGSGDERPRFFDAKAKASCWAKADVVPGRHPERWRKDAAGNVVCKRFCNCQGCLCFEYDHIVPYSKGSMIL